MEIKKPAYYVWTGIALYLLSIFLQNHTTLDQSKVVWLSIFLPSAYIFFYFAFMLLLKSRKEFGAFIFLVLMGLKLVLVMGFLFIFINPTEIENKREILLFFMNYFVFLIVDILIKAKLMNS